MSVVSIRESLGIGIFENFTAESIAKDAEGPWHLTQTPEPQRSLRKALRSQRNSVHADELSVDHPSGGTIKSKEPAVGLFQSKLPPRSTAGQLTLDQHIGVRIPGGQPSNRFSFSTLRVVRKPFFQFPALRLRPVCVCCRHFFGSTIQGVNPSYVFSRNQVAINVNCDLNAAVP